MDRKWTPEHKVAVTEAGVVIKISLAGVNPGSLSLAFEARTLCIRGEHQEFGAFEIKLEIPPGYSLAKLNCTFVKKDILRMDLPPGEDKPFYSDFPKNMLIYCDGCGKHFDIVIAGKGPASYQCTACGKVQVFDLEIFVNKVVQQSNKLGGKKRGRL